MEGNLGVTDESGSEVLVEDAFGVRTLFLNRPDRRNALNEALVSRCAEELERADSDDSVRALVLTGCGTSFCAGGDLRTVGEDRTAEQQKDFVLKHVFRISRALAVLDKPVIAAINGPAVGAGMDIALMCDIRFASSSATLTEGYIAVGVPPGDGGAWLLPRIIGTARALDLLWTGRAVRADEALAMGLIEFVAPDGELMAEATLYAAKLAEAPQMAIRMIKRMTYQAGSIDLATHIDLVSSHMALVRESADFKEGLAAFQEKRSPRFTVQ
jgi:enoyl-CoA hydratase/carnithine racemase